MDKKIPIINQIIKNKRKELKITQEDFTKIINKSIATVRRYDTGDIIPDDTLYLITYKLMIDVLDLIKKQDFENKNLGTNYYNDFIKKTIRDFFNYKSRIKRSESDKLETNLENLFNMFFYDFNGDIIVKKEYNEFKIIEKNENKTLAILSTKEVKNIFEDLKEYFQFKFEKAKKEHLKAEKTKELSEIFWNKKIKK